VAINAIKSYFKLYLRKQVKGFSSIRPPKEYKKPKVYDCYILSEKIQNIENKKHKAILALSLCCWLRKSELLNIKISDINGSLMTLKINQSKGCKDRVVIISENTINILREYHKEYKPKEYLFEGLNGGKYSSTSVDKITKKYLYKDMRFHSLRASGATFALSNGTDLKTVSKILGHKHIQTTEYYIPILYKTIKQAI
jgi:integrase